MMAGGARSHHAEPQKHWKVRETVILLEQVKQVMKIQAQTLSEDNPHSWHRSMDCRVHIEQMER